MYIDVLMRDEKEGRKKQARSNKQQGKATQHTQDVYMCHEILYRGHCPGIYMYRVPIDDVTVHQKIRTCMCNWQAY